MTFDWHMLYPLHTAILDNSQVFGGVPCKAQLCNFSKWFFSPRFGVVPIWELWQFCYVRIGPPKIMHACCREVAPLSFWMFRAIMSMKLPAVRVGFAFRMTRQMCL